MGNVCGWTDRSESKVSVDNVNPLAFILKEIDGTSKELVHEEQSE